MNCYFRQIQKHNFREVFTKKITKLFSVFFAVVLCIASMCSIDAFAEETSPISVSVKADKESYSKGDSLKFNVSVSNSGDSEIGDISLQASLPNKFKITSNEKYTVKLAANETKSYTVSAAPADAKGANSPKTGVTPPIVIMLCFGAAVVIAVKTRKSKKVFSVIITAVLFSALAVPSFTAFTNAASKTEELTAKADFKYPAFKILSCKTCCSYLHDVFSVYSSCIGDMRL